MTRVLVAHESDTLRETARRLLVEAGYEAEVVADGNAAAAALAARPDALVLDVAISGVFAFELLDRLRAEGLPTRTVLVASVYNRTGYKRTPTSLYGADDYVEQHHLPDQLVSKVARLVGPGRPAVPHGGNGARSDGDALRAAGEARMRLRYATVEEGIERARRLACLIVADVALYNGEALARGDLGDLRLRRDLDEGRLLFDLRVPPEIRQRGDFIGEAIAAWRRAPSKEDS